MFHYKEMEGLLDGLTKKGGRPTLLKKHKQQISFFESWMLVGIGFPSDNPMDGKKAKF